MASATPYKIFDAALRHKKALSPHLMRVTLAGPMVTEMATWAPDQRVKLFFPAVDGSPAKLALGDGWYARYRSMPVAQRPAMRTYTIRHLRAEQGEVDIDFVLHGETGPASRWAIHAAAGESIQIVAPDRQFSAQDAGGLNGSHLNSSSICYWSPMPRPCPRRLEFWMSWQRLPYHR